MNLGHRVINISIPHSWRGGGCVQSSALDRLDGLSTLDQRLPDRCPLDIAQLSVLLEMCLSSTYFTFQGEFYKQKKGAAMGSPISPVVANLYMEQFESRALDTAPTPPTMWYRYVDDTMAKIHENAVDSLSEHLNSIDQHIQFTSEQEKDGRIPFLDTCVSINQDEKKIYASTPYIKGISERLQRAFKSHEVTLIHKPVNSLRSRLVRVKDTTVNLKKCGTVYQIHCEKCNKEYVGETARSLEIRVKEHQSRSSSAIHEHCRLEGHSVDPNKTKVLSTEVNTFKRRMKEAIQINLRNRR